jgi:hypothetical protein
VSAVLNDVHLLVVVACRFLRARQFDVAKAKLMIINAEKWRKEFKVDELVQYAPTPFGLCRHV